MTTHAAGTNAFDSAFEANAFECLLADILKGHRKLAHRTLIYQTARALDLPPSILTALILIETNRRPWYIAAAENMFTLLNLRLFTWLGLPLLNVSVGPAQVKLSTAALIEGIPFNGRGKTLRIGQSPGPPERRRCARKLALIVNPQTNIRVAGAYIRLLLEAYCQENRSPCNRETALSHPFLIYLGRHYNGSNSEADEATLRFFPYELVLQAMVERLRKGASL